MKISNNLPSINTTKAKTKFRNNNLHFTGLSTEVNSLTKKTSADGVLNKLRRLFGSQAKEILPETHTIPTATDEMQKMESNWSNLKSVSHKEYVSMAVQAGASFIKEEPYKALKIYSKAFYQLLNTNSHLIFDKKTMGTFFSLSKKAGDNLMKDKNYDQANAAYSFAKKVAEISHTKGNIRFTMSEYATIQALDEKITQLSLKKSKH